MYGLSCALVGRRDPIKVNNKHILMYLTIFILITMDLQCSYCLFMALLYSYSLAGITHIQLLASSGLSWNKYQLESRDHREALFRLASKLMETQNLLDWIEKTPEEQELPELAES